MCILCGDLEDNSKNHIESYIFDWELPELESALQELRRRKVTFAKNGWLTKSKEFFNYPENEEFRTSFEELDQIPETYFNKPILAIQERILDLTDVESFLD